VGVLSALVFRGPGVVRDIKTGLCRLLERDGFSNVAQAVGVDTPRL
jgi:dihydroorotate dehydrogenase